MLSSLSLALISVPVHVMMSLHAFKRSISNCYRMSSMCPAPLIRSSGASRAVESLSTVLGASIASQARLFCAVAELNARELREEEEEELLALSNCAEEPGL